MVCEITAIWHARKMLYRYIRKVIILLISPFTDYTNNLRLYLFLFIFLSLSNDTFFFYWNGRNKFNVNKYINDNSIFFMIVKIKNNTALQMFTKTDNNGKNFVWWRILIILLNVNMQLSSCKSVIWWIVSQRKIISPGDLLFYYIKYPTQCHNYLV
jgi:hypothetical protein